MSEHTPGPWKVSERDPCTILAQPSGLPYTIVVAETCGYKPAREDNSAFIVRACNSHDELLKALKEIMDSDTVTHAMHPTMYTRAAHAIAKAERDNP